MLCELCKKKNANVILKKNEYGKIVEYNVCDSCSSDIITPSFDFSEFNDGFIYNISELLSVFSDIDTEKENIELKCPKCSLSLTEFEKTGILGCESCYEVFKKQLFPLLQRVHGTVQHLGKTPANFYRSKELTKLKEELQKAIDTEEYERAAIIRDKIKELKEKNNES